MSRKKRKSRNTEKRPVESLSRTPQEKLQVRKRDDDFISTTRNRSRRAFEYDYKAYRRFLDKRFFHPDESVRTHRLINTKRSYISADFKHSLARLSFERPKRELPCRQRKERRQVLFAFRLTGKGSRAKHHRFTLESRIFCR